MVRTAAVAVALAASLAGCGGLTNNHARGLAAVGAVATLFGATTLADGASCDTRYDVHSTCTSDAAELRDGAIITTAGVALVGVAVWRLIVDADPHEAPRARLATAPAPTGRAAHQPTSRTAPRD